MSRTRDAATYEEDERARAEYQNQALAERNRVHGAAARPGARRGAAGASVVALSLVDPLDGAAVWREHVRHEGAHALGAILLGFDFDDVCMDPYHDFGSGGALQGLRRDPLTSKTRASDDPMADLAEFERLEYLDHEDRSVVARLGVMATLAQSWSGGGASGDRENVESNRPADYSPGAWDHLVEHAPLRLLRREEFRFKHAAVVRALEREGRLTYEQVAELVSGSQLEPTPGAEDAAA